MAPGGQARECRLRLKKSKSWFFSPRVPCPPGRFLDDPDLYEHFVHHCPSSSARSPCHGVLTRARPAFDPKVAVFGGTYRHHRSFGHSLYKMYGYSQGAFLEEVMPGKKTGVSPEESCWRGLPQGSTLGLLLGADQQLKCADTGSDETARPLSGCVVNISQG